MIVCCAVPKAKESSGERSVCLHFRRGPHPSSSGLYQAPLGDVDHSWHNPQSDPARQNQRASRVEDFDFVFPSSIPRTEASTGLIKTRWGKLPPTSHCYRGWNGLDAGYGVRSPAAGKRVGKKTFRFWNVNVLRELDGLGSSVSM